MPSTRPPAVAGAFYPGQAAILASDIRSMLDDAKKTRPFVPKALIVPHAGYMYSGPIAATAYATLQDHAQTIQRVVLLGPTHRVAVRGLALPGAEVFSTPLGDVPVDQDAIRSIAHLPQVSISPEAHALEHSLEVQIPFLQIVLGDFQLLPLAVGMASAEEVDEVLELLWGGDETLIVISSDLSHYLPYEIARHMDSTSIRNIEAGQPLSHEQACGATPINGMMLAARKHHLHPKLLDLRNSGDTAGPRNGVVGYASLAYIEGGSE